ncbi:MAG: autotransporter-associated beta strand repeat-containing protein [Verrucomicrobia bacterium]|nr:autotransporter-associated beta strand repeat-containing protein [Verrucomicrobiota bacterium]
MAGTGSTTLTNNGSGTNTVRLNGGLLSTVGKIVQNSATSTLWLRGDNNAFTGTIEILKGTLFTGNSASSFGTTAGQVTLGASSGSDAATLELSDNSTQTYNAKPIVLGTTAGTLTIRVSDDTGTNTHTVAGAISGVNNLTLESAVGDDKLTFATGGINNTGTITHIGAGSGDLTINSVIGPNVTGVIQNSATSKMVLAGTNTFSGTTTVTAGTLALTNNQALQNSALDTTGSGVVTFTGTTPTIGGLNGSVNLATKFTSGYTGSVTTLTLNPVSGVTATYSGVIANGTMALTKTGLGTQILSGANTYTGLTTISAGTLKLGATGDATNTPLGTILAGTTVSGTGTLDLNGFTLGTAEGLSLSGTGTSSSGALANSAATAATYSGLVALGGSASIVAGGGTGANIILSNVGTISGATFGLTLGGTATGSSIASIIGTTSGTVTKQGTGTWTLSGANTYTGTTTINGGTLQVGNGTTGSLNGTTGTALTFAAPGGTFNVSAGSGVSQGMGALSYIAGGDNTVKSTNNGGNSFLTFSSMAVHANTGQNTNPGTINFVVSGGTNGTDNKIVLTSVTGAGANGAAGRFIDKAAYFNGSDFAWYDSTGYVRGINYGTDSFPSPFTVDNGTIGPLTSITSSGGTSVSGNFIKITGPISAQTAQGDNRAFNTVNIAASTSFNIANNVIYYTASILKSGGNSATIGGTGSASITTMANARLFIRTDLSSDTLTINIPVTSSGSGALTKSGAGTLFLTAANTVNSGGNLVINDGTLQLGNGGATGSVSTATSIENYGSLVFNRNNLVAQGTDFGSIIGSGSVTQAGTGFLSLNGANTYTGGTNINSGTVILTGTTGLGTTGNITFTGNSTLRFGAATTTDLSSRLVMTNGVTSTIDIGVNNVTFASAFGSSTSGALTKVGSGTLTLSGANTYTGTTTINSGTALVTGSLNGTTGTPLTFAGSATVNFSEASGVSQGMGALTFSTGDGTVQSTNNGGNSFLTFASIGSRAVGSTGNFIASGGTNGTTNKIALTSTANAPVSTGSNNPGLFFGGTEYARYDAANYFRATTYGTDTNAPATVATGTNIGSVTSISDIKITGAITAQTTASVNTINLGANNFTITAANTLSVNGLLSTGTLTFGAAANQGTIQPTSSGGEIVVNANAGTLTLNSVIANNTNPSTLTKTGNGTLTLGGTNSYTGGTNIGAGTISFTTGGLGTTGNVAFTGNSTLQYGTATTTDLSSRLVMSNGVTSTIDTGANNVTFASNIGSSTTAILTKAGTGTLTLGGTNTYTGGTNIGAGTLSFTTGGLGTTGSITFTGNSTLQYGTATTTDLTSRLVMTNSVTSTIDTNGNNVTFASAFGNSSSGALTKVGSGTLTLSATNTYTGNTTINQGAITNANSQTSTSTTGSLIFTGTATYTEQADNSSTHNYGALNFSAGDGFLTYQASGNGVSFSKFSSLSRSPGATGNFLAGQLGGAGSLNLNGKLQITSGVALNQIINPGIYYAGADFAGYAFVAGGSGGNTTVALIYGTDLDTVAVNTITASKHVKLTTNPASRTGDTLLTLNLAGSGVGYTMTGGTLTLSSGGLIKSGGGTVGTISGGTGITTGGSTELVIRTDVAGDSLTISTPILSSSTGGLTKSGLGTLTLSNTANAYTGVTTINAGSLLLGAAGVITDTSDVTTDRAGILNLNGNSETIGGLNGAGTVTTNTAAGTSILTVGASNVASATFSGVIQDNGSGKVALIKSGTGTQILSGTNTYTGLTTVSVGTLEVTVNNALGTIAAGTSVTAGATLKLTNVNYSTTEGLTINGTGVSSGGALASSGTSTFAGQITAATDATINAISGTLALTGGLVKNATTLTFTGAGAFTISGTGISGTGPLHNSDLVVNGTTVTETVANTYDGPTTITNGGTLIANVTGALPLSPRSAFTFSGSGSPTLNLGASQEVASLSSSTTSAVVNLSATGTNTLTVGAASGTTTFTGNIGGTTGNLTKDNASTQVLSGTNTYTGNTLVSAGTLQFAKQASLYNNGAAAAWSNTNINVNSSATMAFNIGGSGEFTKTDILNLLGLANATTNGFKTGAILGLDTTSADFLFNSVIANPNSGTNVLGLTKLGTNKLTLDQANTYTGTTTVSGGTLAVTGSLSGTTAVTVNTGGTLLMNGATSNIVGNGNMTPGSGTTINGNKTGIGANAGANFTGSGGTLAVAQGAGGNGTTHSFNQMTLTANSTLDFSSGGAGNTNVNMIFASLDTATKTALFNGTTTLTINGWGNTSYLSQLGTGPYTLGTNSNPGAVDGGSFNDGQNRLIFTSDPGFGLGNFIAGINFTGFGGGATQVAFGTNQWEIVPVPEPATTALIGSIALCALVGYRERRRFTGLGKRMAARK